MSARAWFYAQGQRAMALHPGIRSFGLLRLLFGMQNVPEWAREAFRRGVHDARGY